MITASQISSLWNATDSSAHVKQLFLQHLSLEGDAKKHDFQKWNEYEMRFEAGELEWISDFILHNLVFCKSQLKLTNDRSIAVVMQALWQTLDLFSDENDLSLSAQMSSRYERLQNTVKKLHAENEISTA